MTEELSYPIGRFQYDDKAPRRRAEWIDQIAEAPAKLREAVRGLDDAQLDTPYRPGGWTVRQVVHHVPDSHINSYVRFHLAVTEDEPAIQGYDENLWAALPDARSAPVEYSLRLLDALHARWVLFLRGMSDEQFGRRLRHSELGPVTLDRYVALYAWHGRHHAAHITRLRERMGW